MADVAAGSTRPEDVAARRVADRRVVTDRRALEALARPDRATRLAAWLRFGRGARMLAIPGIRRVASAAAGVAARLRGRG